jgi:hypothetical protein
MLGSLSHQPKQGEKEEEEEEEETLREWLKKTGVKNRLYHRLRNFVYAFRETYDNMNGEEALQHSTSFSYPSVGDFEDAKYSVVAWLIDVSKTDVSQDDVDIIQHTFPNTMYEAIHYHLVKELEESEKSSMPTPSETLTPATPGSLSSIT